MLIFIYYYLIVNITLSNILTIILDIKTIILLMKIMFILLSIQKLIKENYKLVPHYAKPYLKKYKFTYDEKNDLLQEGYMGFIRACEKYDINKNTTISTYSYYWINAYFNRYIKKMLLLKKNIPLQLDYYKSKPEKIIIDLNSLSDSEINMIKKRYYHKEKLKDIAITYNISTNTLRLRYKKILNQLYYFNKI